LDDALYFLLQEGKSGLYAYKYGSDGHAYLFRPERNDDPDNADPPPVLAKMEKYSFEFAMISS
jgi:hypothetical protein